MEKEPLFFNRSKEIEVLKKNFENSIKDKSQTAFFIRGKKGIGKTRLVLEFINKIENEIGILAEMPDFTSTRNLISYQCEPKTREPYDPFIRITKKILENRRFLEFSYNIFKAFLSYFGIKDIIEAFIKLGASAGNNKDAEILKQKEIQLFNKYRKFIRNRSSKSPLIFFIQNVQWIDLYSLKLIQKLVSDKKQFWGMIILEQDDAEISEELNDELNTLLTSNGFNKIDLYSLDRSFPSKILTDEFGQNFFNNDENDLLYTISEGNPGNLIDFIENTCVKNKYIYRENGEWKKKSDFKECIKPVNQKLLELIISLHEDKVLSESESRLIKKMATIWGISNSYVAQTVNMVKDVMQHGYRIISILNTGIISNNSFLVTDTNNRRYIIEHVKINSQDCESLFGNRGFENEHLLEAVSCKVCENGVLIIWEYYDGKKTRQASVDEFAKHISDSIQKFVQISEGLAELHRYSTVHGFVTPRSIVETAEGKYQLATINHEIFKYLINDPEENNVTDIHFLAPEQLKGSESSIQSDVFSLGIMFYSALTNRFPFHGKSAEELIDSVKSGKIEYKGSLESLIPDEIKEIIRISLSFNAKARFRSAEEFYNKLKAVKFDEEEEQKRKKIEEEEEEEKRKKKEEEEQIRKKKIAMKKKMAKALVAVGTFALLIVVFNYYYHSYKTFSKTVCEESTINIESVDKTINKSKVLDPELTEYLLRYDISTKSNLIILNRAQFNVIHSPKKKDVCLPHLNINVKITNGEFDHMIELKITDNSQAGSVLKRRVTFRDASELLNGKLDNLTSDLGTKKVKGNFLTKDWDAFVNFYDGERNWIILNKDKAGELFRRSISIDSTFLLPKLRLAKIYRFDGKNREAIEILRTIRASIDRLSRPDSLRTVALWNILNGNTREAINNYKALISYLPGQKEPFYEIAEAYFEMSDINNAIINYRYALEIDPDFTLALNHLGYCFSHSGLHESALFYFKKYVALDSTANSFDSYGDGFFASGILDSAKWAKQKGLELDPNLDYLYSSLAYINIREGKLNEAESNIDKYLSYQTDPEKISTGLANKAFIYLIKGEYKKSLDTCLKAKSKFDSRDLVTRNHVLHWVLSRIYFETKNNTKLAAELSEMQDIIALYKIDEFNYNMIYKYYNDILVHKLIEEKKYDKALSIIAIFDNELYNKVKDWSSPFDIAFLNVEFGKSFLKRGKLDLARERFTKALEYNSNYALAHLYIFRCYQNPDKEDQAAKHMNEFKRLTPGADPDYLILLNSYQI